MDAQSHAAGIGIGIGIDMLPPVSGPSFEANMHAESALGQQQQQQPRPQAKMGSGTGTSRVCEKCMVFVSPLSAALFDMLAD